MKMMPMLVATDQHMIELIVRPLGTGSASVAILRDEPISSSVRTS